MKIAGDCVQIINGKGAIVLVVRNELDGEPHELDVRCWGKLADHVRGVDVGDRIEAEGRCETKPWTSPQGKTMRFTNFNAAYVEVKGTGTRTPPPSGDDTDNLPF